VPAKGCTWFVLECLRTWGFGRADISRDDAQQPARVGLGDEPGSAELDGLVAERLIVVRREHHDGRRMGVPAAGDAHGPQHFDAGHIRHGHVEQNQRHRRLAADERQGPRALYRIRKFLAPPYTHRREPLPARVGGTGLSGVSRTDSAHPAVMPASGRRSLPHSRFPGCAIRPNTECRNHRRP
jgi:hypothetical protein